MYPSYFNALPKVKFSTQFAPYKVQKKQSSVCETVLPASDDLWSALTMCHIAKLIICRRSSSLNDASHR